MAADNKILGQFDLIERGDRFGGIERAFNKTPPDADQFAQQRHAHRLVVDERFAAAVGFQLAFENQRLAGLNLYSGILDQHGNTFRQPREFETGSNTCAVFAGAHQRTVGAVAQNQTKRVEQDRFARAGLTGKHAQPGGKTKVERLDQHDVADGESGQHVRALF